MRRNPRVALAGSPWSGVASVEPPVPDLVAEVAVEAVVVIETPKRRGRPRKHAKSVAESADCRERRKAKKSGDKRRGRPNKTKAD